MRVGKVKKLSHFGWKSGGLGNPPYIRVILRFDFTMLRLSGIMGNAMAMPGNLI